MGVSLQSREALVRRGIRLSYATIGYNVLEAIGSLVAGFLAGSVALVGFGIDSVIEVTASIAAQWRLRSDWDPERRDRVEVLTTRFVGWCFLALALYVLFDAATTLVKREPPEGSAFGVFVLLLSVIVMPVLASRKKRVARGSHSNFVVCLPIRDRSRWSRAQRRLCMVVGGSGRGPDHGSNHCCGRNRRSSRGQMN